MIPVDQTRFGGGSPGGNCLMACVASIMGRSIAECIEVNTDDPHYWEQLQKWLIAQGWQIRYRPRLQDVPSAYGIANGPGPRGLLHSCVALDGEIVHDPHPSRAGLLEITSWHEVTRITPIPPAPGSPEAREQQANERLEVVKW